MSSQVPTVGLIVHVTQRGSPEHVPAVICYVHPSGAHRSDPAKDGILLNVGCWDCHGEPTPGIQGIPEDQTGQREMSWHWPERYSATSDRVFTTPELEERIRTLEDLLIQDNHGEDPEIEGEDEDEDTVDFERPDADHDAEVSSQKH